MSIKTIIILIIIFLIVALSSHLVTDSIKRQEAKVLQERAGGGNNADAREALALVQAIDAPTPEDRLMRADLLRFNVLENNLARLQENILVAIIGNYMEAAGVIPRAGAVDINNERMEARPFIFDRMEPLIIYGGPFAQVVNTTRQVDVATRQQNALEATDTKIDAIHEYFKDAITYTNDAQSVHDSKANGDLRKSIAAIETNVDVPAMFELAHAYVRTKPEHAKAIATLNMMALCHHLDTLNMAEDRILALVWARTLTPENRANAENLREAIYLALVDCWEHGNLVCMNGRCGRVLGALVGIDAAGISVMTTEAYRNQIYQECIKTIDSTLAYAKNDPVLREAAEAYFEEDPKETEASATLKTMIKKNIDTLVDAYTNFSEQERQRLKEECYISAILD